MRAANDDRIHISAAGVSADIDPFGAELCVLRDSEGRDLLYDGDPRWWTGRAPLLFPIVGALASGAYRLGREAWRLPQHGFARHSLFNVEAREPDSVSLRLRESEETRSVYPFPFQLDVTFAVSAATLSVQAVVTNRGRRPMPMALGFHPAFRWPLPYGGARDEHELEFEVPEHGQVFRPDGDGLLIGPRRTPVRADGRLPLNDDLFVDGAVVFKELASHRVTYGVRGQRRIVVDFAGMPSLGVWSKPGAQAPFVCVEPWQGYADDAPLPGDPPKSRDLFDRPGMIELAPGQSHAFGMRVSLVDA